MAQQNYHVSNSCCICHLATNNLCVCTWTGTELLPSGKQWVWLLG